MAEGTRSLGGLWSLPRTRGLVSSPRAKLLLAAVAALYLIASAIVGGMLPSASPSSVLRGASSPGLLASMVGVAGLVGLGMTAGLVLSYRLFVLWRTPSARARALGPLAALTPAMVALLTLGTCCATAAAAVAGVAAAGMALPGALGPAAGAGLLTLVQVVLVALSLVAQEGLLQAFPQSLAPPPEARRRRPTFHPRGTPPVRALRGLLALALAGWAVAAIVRAAVGGPESWLGGGAAGQIEPATLWMLGLVGLALTPAFLAAHGATRWRGATEWAGRGILAALAGALALGVPLTLPAPLPEAGGPDRGRGSGTLPGGPALPPMSDRGAWAGEDRAKGGIPARVRFGTDPRAWLGSGGGRSGDPSPALGPPTDFSGIHEFYRPRNPRPHRSGFPSRGPPGRAPADPLARGAGIPLLISGGS